jgi:hypothetical protein
MCSALGASPVRLMRDNRAPIATDHSGPGVCAEVVGALVGHECAEHEGIKGLSTGWANAWCT